MIRKEALALYEELHDLCGADLTPTLYVKVLLTGWCALAANSVMELLSRIDDCGDSQAPPQVRPDKREPLAIGPHNIELEPLGSSLGRLQSGSPQISA